MAENVFVGNGNVAKKVKRSYVGVNGKAREVIKGYIGVNGVAKRFYVSKNWLEKIGVTRNAFNVTFSSIDGVTVNGILQNNNLNF